MINLQKVNGPITYSCSGVFAGCDLRHADVYPVENKRLIKGAEKGGDTDEFPCIGVALAVPNVTIALP
jgi:hypothetical protein